MADRTAQRAVCAAGERSLLVTAFMPFGGDRINPTELVLCALPGEIGGFALHKLLLPVEFGRAASAACAEYDRLSPAAVIMLGQAGGRDAITPEAVGVNEMDARIPDNAGAMPLKELILPGGERELLSTLPNESIVRAVSSLGLNARVSRDAGRYVCNSLLYGMLAHVRGSVPAGFIHVPFIREQTEGTEGRENTPYMELADIERGVLAAVSAVVSEIG